MALDVCGGRERGGGREICVCEERDIRILLNIFQEK